MSTPTVFPSGIGTYPGGHVLSSFPNLPTRYQVVKSDDFTPYIAGNYTVTTGGTSAAVAAVGWNGGVVGLTGGSTTPFKATIGLAANIAELVPGNGVWFEARMAAPTGSQTNPSTDADIYAGIFDNADPSAAANGIYFLKPAGGSAVHFVVKKATVVTTFQNVADFAEPSGAFNDPLDVAGVITANATGTTLTSLAVTTPGFGYRRAPLVFIRGTAGSGAAAYIQTGGAQGFPTTSAKQPGSSLYSPVITNAGSGYTAGTFTVDVLPWIDFNFFYDGKGRLVVGVGGRTVLTLDKDAQTAILPAATVNVATGAKSYNFKGTTLTAGIMPVQPVAGDPIVALPLVPLTPGLGIVGSTANARVAYADRFALAVEAN